MLYGYPDGLSMREKESWEIQAATTVLRDILERGGISPDQIGCFSLGCGTPIVTEYAELLAEELGIPRDCLILETNTACNSAARAMERLYLGLNEHPELGDRPAIVMGHEGLRRLLNSWYDTSQADAFSLSVFGDASAAILLTPNRLKLITSKTLAQRDSRGYLATIETYPVDKSENANLIQTKGNKERIQLPPTRDGKKINLQPIKTTIMMAGLAAPLLRMGLETHKRMIENGEIEEKPIEFLIAHHPSIKMLEKVCKDAEVDQALVPWVVREGNSSGATSMEAAVRLLPFLKPGQRFGWFAMGAGMQGNRNDF